MHVIVFYLLILACLFFLLFWGLKEKKLLYFQGGNRKCVVYGFERKQNVVYSRGKRKLCHISQINIIWPSCKQKLLLKPEWSAIETIINTDVLMKWWRKNS